jgi:hypothetical protein
LAAWRCVAVKRQMLSLLRGGGKSAPMFEQLVSMLTDECERRSSVCVALATRLAAQEAELQTLKSTLHAKTAEFDSKSADYEHLLQEKDEELQGQQLRERKQVISLTDESERRASECLTLSAKLTAQEAELARVTSMLCTKSADFDSKSAECLSLSAKLAAQEAEVQTLKSTLHTKTAEFDSKSAEYQHELQQKDQELREQLLQWKQVEKELGQKSAELVAEGKKFFELEEELKESRQQVEELQKTVEELLSITAEDEEDEKKHSLVQTERDYWMAAFHQKCEDLVEMRRQHEELLADTKEEHLLYAQLPERCWEDRICFKCYGEEVESQPCQEDQLRIENNEEEETQSLPQEESDDEEEKEEKSTEDDDEEKAQRDLEYVFCLVELCCLWLMVSV